MNDISIDDMIAFCRESEARCLGFYRGRLESAASFRSGSEQEWEAAARMVGALPMSKRERTIASGRDERIAGKYAKEAKMYGAIAEKLSGETEGR